MTYKKQMGTKFVYTKRGKIMKHKGALLVLTLFGFAFCLTLSAGALPQLDEVTVWQAFTAWIRTNPESTTLKAYGEKLAKEGMSQQDVQSNLEIIRRKFKEDPLRSIEITYDRIFSKPLTGDMEKDGFTSQPSEFMMESVIGMESAGRALDVGTGQGRNAVWLAQQGWEVTGIDISEGGLAAAASNAERAGVRISTVKTAYQDFDFGKDQWDLIVMILSWAPVSDPDFVNRLNESLRPGGALVFEHVLITDKQKFPAYVEGLTPNSLLEYFADFYIQYYEEGVWQGDWGGPPAELVRLIATKKKN